MGNYMGGKDPIPEDHKTDELLGLGDISHSLTDTMDPERIHCFFWLPGPVMQKSHYLDCQELRGHQPFLVRGQHPG